MAVSLETAESYVSELEKAYLAAISGSSYTIDVGGSKRTLSRQNIEIIKEELLYWNNYVEQKKSGKSVDTVKIKLGRPLC